MQIINPATEEISNIEETPIGSITDIVKSAKAAYQIWSEKSVDQRVAILRPLCVLMEQNREALNQTITQDMGKPIKKANAELDTALQEAVYLLDNASDWLSPEKSGDGFVEYDGIGVVGVISPWNFPLLLPLRGILPALVAGNSVVFKPSEQTLLTGKAIGDLFLKLENIPPGLVQTIVGGKDHGRTLVNADVAMIAFTGSSAAGKEIMKSCADNLKRVQLELGGMDAAIVLNDVNIARTAKKILERNCSNSGQVCCSIKRVYVEEEIYPEFLQSIVNYSKEVTTGDPNDAVDMGPLVAKFQLDKVEEFVADARKKGAKIHSGGARLPKKGYYYPSTIVSEVSDEMRISKEEAFGPVLPIFSVKSWQEAVELANASPYGLTGSVWTENEELGRSIARKLEVGVANVNAHGSGPVGTPWGGTKQSGFGRMKTREGLLEFTNIKLIRVLKSE